MSEANSADGCGLAADTVSPEIYVIMLLACLLIFVLVVLFIFSTKLKAAEQRHGDSEEQLKAAGAARDKAAREQLIAADARASSAEAKLTKLEQDHKFLKQQHKKALEAAQTAEEAAEAAEVARKAAEEREAAAQEMIREMNKQRERQQAAAAAAASSATGDGSAPGAAKHVVTAAALLASAESEHKADGWSLGDMLRDSDVDVSGLVAHALLRQVREHPALVDAALQAAGVSSPGHRVRLFLALDGDAAADPPGVA